MSKLRIAVNGFGRIGRLTTRILANNNDIEIVAINDLTDVKTLAHLFQWDTAHKQFDGTVGLEGEHMVINGQQIKVYSEKDPAQLPWKDLGVDVVLESTGRFVNEEGASKHLAAGAGKVLISAPAKGGNIPTFVMGVNDADLNADIKIMSNASCTTNCLAPMVKVLDELLGIDYGLMTTTHAYTADQRLQDAPHKDLRRARAAAENIVPTSTGAAKAVGLVLPHLNGKLNGTAMRVPTITGSATELNAMVNKTASVEDINAAFKEAAVGALNGVLEYSEMPLVSSDIIGNPHSCIFDSGLTMTMNSMVRILGWYDNEAGYSNRLADLMVKLGNM
jgi:glyceraldehyde 3-phosphate dehydrogenase